MSADGMRPKDGVVLDDERDGHGAGDDGLDALASQLGAHSEGADVDDDLDLAKLAAVASAPAASAAREREEEARVDLSSVAPADRRPAPGVPAVRAFASREPAPAAHHDEHDLHIPGVNRRPWLVPALLVAALGLAFGGYALGRNSSEPPHLAAPAPSTAPSSAPGSAPLAAAPAPEPTPAAPAAATAALEPAPAPALPAPAPAAPAPAQASAPAESAPTQVEPVRSASAGPKPAAPRSASSPSAAESAAPVVAAREEPKLVLVPKTEAPPPEAAKAAVPAAAPRTVDALLDDALANPRDRALREPAETGLPEAPSRDEVTAAMSVIAPAIRGCAMGQTGLATAAIVVRGDGRVASVEVGGAPFAGTASGRCMEGVIRRAHFSRFRQPTFRVRFPFSIQ